MKKAVTNTRVMGLLIALKATVEANEGKPINISSIMKLLGANSGLHQAILQIGIIRPLQKYDRMSTYEWAAGTITEEMVSLVIARYTNICQAWKNKANNSIQGYAVENKSTKFSYHTKDEDTEPNAEAMAINERLKLIEQNIADLKAIIEDRESTTEDMYRLVKELHNELKGS